MRIDSALYQPDQISQSLQSRAIGFGAQLRRQLTGTYVFSLTAPDMSTADVTLSVGPEVAVHKGAVAQPTFRLLMSEQDFGLLLEGRSDPMTLYTTHRLRVEDGAGTPQPLHAVRKLLQMLLVQWRIDDEAIGAIERHGADPYGNASVDVVSQLSAQDFMQQNGYRGHPVVFRGAAKEWPLVTLSPTDLSRSLGDLTVPLYIKAGAEEPSGQGPIQTAGRTFSTIKLGEFIETVFLRQRKLGDLQGVTPYVTALSVPDEILSLIDSPTYFPAEAFVRPKMWAGPSGTLTPLHRDLIDNFLVQIWGYKHLRLITPTIARELQPVQEDLNPYFEPARIDADTPNFDQFPGCDDVPYIDCVIGPGDMIYLPAGWWHRVRSLEASLSVNFFALNKKPLMLERF
jgi:hypothetical protein